MQSPCKVVSTETEKGKGEKKKEIIYAKNCFYCEDKNMQDFLMELQK